MDKSSLGRRLVGLGLLLVACIIICIFTLYNIQIIDGEEYRQMSSRRSTRSMTENAARGEILDRYGRPLVTSKMAFSLSLDYYSLNKETQNDLIVELVSICDTYQIEHGDSLPISLIPPFEYIGDDNSKKELLNLLTDKEIIEGISNYDEITAFENVSATEMMDALEEYYKVDKTLSDDIKRTIIGVRYEMSIRQFSTYNPFTFASDIPIEMVSQVEEKYRSSGGIMIEVESVRQYETTYAAHILGQVNEIWAEDWDYYNELGYSMDAIVGISGAEKAFEEYLRGFDGKLSIETDIAGNVVNTSEIVETIPGNNVMLTIDLALQEAVESSLAIRMQEIREKGKSSASASGDNAEGAAAIVLDVNTGEILAIASYPTFNLTTFNKDYSILSSDPLSPMMNRATGGVYQPGSTYKVASSIMALEHDIIEPNTIIRCLGRYTFYDDYQPRCWIYKDYGSTHGNVDVSDALKQSCNYFYYEIGRLLTGEVMEDYAHRLGLGEATGIELGEALGNVAGPDSRAEKGMDWEGGASLQAAIGQSDHQFTPIQLASMVATVINGGTRYETTILKEVRTNDNEQIIEANDPVVIEDLNLDAENVLAIKEGMNDVVNEGGTAASVFRNYPIAIGGKSGSAQTGIAGEDAHGLFVAFAPYDEPEIVVCVVGENAGSGSNVAPMVRDILDAYFFTGEQSDDLPQNYTLLP